MAPMDAAVCALIEKKTYEVKLHSEEDVFFLFFLKNLFLRHKVVEEASTTQNSSKSALGSR